VSYNISQSALNFKASNCKLSTSQHSKQLVQQADEENRTRSMHGDVNQLYCWSSLRAAKYNKCVCVYI